MPRRLNPLAAAAIAALAALFAGAYALAASPVATSSATALTSWPEFGLNPQRSDATAESTGIDAANVGHLHAMTVALPATADNSAIYLHQALVEGSRHDVAIVTTDYGTTLAIDAVSGRIASPIAIGDYVYTTSPDGLVHKLSIASGLEQHGWPVAITRTSVDSSVLAPTR